MIYYLYQYSSQIISFNYIIQYQIYLLNLISINIISDRSNKNLEDYIIYPFLFSLFGNYIWRLENKIIKTGILRLYQ